MSTSTSRVSVPLIAVLAIFGCDRRVVVDVDAGAPLDASSIDSAAMTVAKFGLCSSDAQCEAGLFCETAYPGRFCTHECASESDCGDDGFCSSGRCVPLCRSGNQDCDPFGGACLVGPESLCVPACNASGITTSMCAGDLACDPYSGDCTSTPVTAGEDVGGPCVEHADCRSGVCLAEGSSAGATGWLGGMCVGTTRSSGPSTVERGGCPPGSVTTVGVAVGDLVVCLPECMEHSECRPGYYCGRPLGAPIGYCFPINCDDASAPPCPAGSTCQLLSNGRRRCARCTPACASRECGPDECGGTCGECDGSSVCTAEGRCECVAETDAELCAASGAECGSLTVTDRCGASRALSCGSCVSPEACGALTPNQCDCAGESDAALCAAAGASCGTISATDRCGALRSVACGSCAPPSTCGAIVPNQCGCIAESDVELCSARGASCGTIAVTDRCGATRTVSCGACTPPETCGGAGVPNTCGICVPNCSGRVCGSDGCGGSCGSCGAGDRCTTAGRCEPIPCDPVLNTMCSTGQKCDWTGSSTMCIAAGTGLAGDSCMYSVECAGEHTCTGELFCREYCTSHSHCRAGRCAYNLTGSTYGLCSRACNPVPSAGPSGCEFGESCRLLNTSRATEVTDCGEYGSAFLGDPCTATSQCFSGYTCVGGSCRRPCLLGTTCSSGACALVSGWATYGVCP